MNKENSRLAFFAGSCVVGLFALLSLATGLFGPTGEALSGALTDCVGITSWAVPLLMVLAGLAVLRGWKLSAFQMFADAVLLVVVCTFADLVSEGAGGALGGFVGDAAQVAFGGTAGALCVAFGFAVLWSFVRLDAVGFLKRSVAKIEGWASPEWTDVVPSRGLSECRGSVSEDRVVERNDAPAMIFTNQFQAAIDEALRRAESPDPYGLRARLREAAQEVGLSAVQSAKKKSVVSEFALPSTALLAEAEAGNAKPDDALLQAEERLLVSTLGSYDVDAKIEEIVSGPTLTTFEAAIAPGTKLSKVIGLSDDLSLAFGRKVRVVPARLGRVAFEVPTEERAPVGLRELLEDERWKEAREEMALPIVLGRDPRGEGVFADLADMPHVLAAGATGAGKSVGLNVMLASLLYSRTPEELRLIMIDPKVVELQPYARIPHMLLPVVTDMGKAKAALVWAVDEMEERYQMLARAGCKNITSYNDARRQRRQEVLPRIVIVIDEYADLFASQGKAVEALVSRLAQKARAAGMHLILATQRPSVDVITGTIKANFPTRVAFRVAQRVDSRVVLDEQGAEQLAGRGDMLVKLGGEDALLRAQCPMITEEEIEALTGYLCTQGMPDYDESILDEEEAPEPDKKKRARKSAGKVLS